MYNHVQKAPSPELVNSEMSLCFHLREIEEFENTLAGINKESNNSDFSYRAEIILSQLSVQTHIILKLKNKVKAEEKPLTDLAARETTETIYKRLDSLRKEIYRAEKDYLKVKYYYQKFIFKYFALLDHKMLLV